MALARKSLLSALDGLDAPSTDERSAIQLDRPVPFLEAWDRLWIAWSLALRGELKQARPHLEHAADFFRRHGLRPGAELARLIHAEGLLLAGDPRGAGEILRVGDGRGNQLTAVIRPLLQARLLLEADGAEEASARCHDLLTEAAAVLAENPLRGWSSRLAELRRTLARLNESPNGSSVQRATRSTKRPDSTRLLPSGLGTRVLDGPSQPSRTLARLVARCQGTDLPVLIQGETGTGKERVARAIHDGSPRRASPFCAVDCASLPEGLLEAELFGSRAGSFTGGTEDRAGILSQAAGGTVLIDDVGNLPLEGQSKLVRVLGEKKVRPLGADEEVALDVRFLFSSAEDLEEKVRQGRFRADLFHRLNVLRIQVPALRERPEDFPSLVETLLAEEGSPRPILESRVLERLRAHPWPGNVREMKNLLARLRLEGEGVITLQAVERLLGRPETTSYYPAHLLGGDSLPTLKHRLERDFVVHHFRRLGNRTTALGTFLGLSRRQLFRVAVRLGIRFRDVSRSSSEETNGAE